MIPVRVPPHSRRRIETGPASARDYRAVYAITRPCIFQPNELFDMFARRGLRLSAGVNARFDAWARRDSCTAAA
jgi:hypothetical protein